MKKSGFASVIALLCVGVMTTTAFADSFGVCTHMGLGNSYDNVKNIQSAEEVKVGWIRDECRWQNMQTSPGVKPKIRDKDMDYIQKADAAGLNQLLILAYGNASYDGVAYDTVVPKAADEDYWQGWLDYVTYTVNQVKDYVEAYEIWNEPNYKSFNYNLAADGEDYAKLYLATKAIINNLDPTAKVLCGAITGYDEIFAKSLFDYVKTQGNVNELIDVFSIHHYPQLDMDAYAQTLSNWESLFDSYGFTGDVWMTENSVTADNAYSRTETAQAQSVAKFGTLWEKYLMENNRNGISFWYDLRNDVGISDYEDNFGLVDQLHNIKPAGKAMEIYNRLTGDKSLSEYSKPQTAEESKLFGLSKTQYYGKLAKYTNDSGTVYVAYDENGRSDTKMDIPLSGDIAYVYNYLGEITETINNPTGTKTLSVTASPQYVEMGSYKAKIDRFDYDNEEVTATVYGSYNGGNSVTIELLQNGSVVSTQTASVVNGAFKKEFSFFGDGEYTVRAGKKEIEALGKTSGWAEKTVSMTISPTASWFDASTEISYNASTNTVNITGTINGYEKNGIVTILAIPESMNVSEADIKSAAYVGQINAKDGNFSAKFTVPKWFTTDMAIYLGGEGIKQIMSDTVGIDESAYLYVGALSLDKGDVLKATALVRNFNETERKAVMIVAQYEGDRLVGVKTEEKTVPAKTYAAIECPLDNVEIDSSAVTAKAFIWGDTNTIVPLFNDAELKLKN